MNCVKVSRRYCKIMRKKSEECSSKRATSLISKEMWKYFDNNPVIRDMAESIPKEYFSRRKKPSTLLLVDDVVAEKTVNAIKPYLTDYKGCILEINPGIGLISKRLMKHAKDLRLYEANPTFLSLLQKMENDDHCITHVEKINLLQPMYEMPTAEECDGVPTMHAICSRLPKTAWHQEGLFRIIGSLPNSLYISYLISSFIHQRFLMSRGRPEMYFYMPSSLSNTLMLGPKQKGTMRERYRTLSIAFQIIFEMELLLDNVPRRAFLPWQRSTGTRNTQATDRYEEMMHLVRIKGKASILDRIGSDNLKSFWFFLNQFSANLTKCVIPTFEEKVNGCGPRLIVRDYSIFTRFGDLTPDEFLELFEEIFSWSDFEKGILTSASDHQENSETVPREKIDLLNAKVSSVREI